MDRFPCQTGIRPGTGSPARQRVVREIVGCPSGRTCGTARGCRQEGQRKFEIAGVSAGWAQASSPSPLRIPQYGAEGGVGSGEARVDAGSPPARADHVLAAAPDDRGGAGKLGRGRCVVLHFDSCGSDVS